MLSKQDALTAERFHEDSPRRKDGTCYVHRRNGKTQTWKTRPNDFRVPVKYGMYQYGSITPHNAEYFHTEANCPYGNVG